MSDAFKEFDNRLRRIDRIHEGYRRGMTPKIGPDGLITITGRKARRRVPLKGLVLLILGFVGLKGFMLAQIGPEEYGERIAELKSGTIVEQAGASIMGADPATKWIADKIRPFIP